ncbi:hypothetical protein GWK47_046925 [Chionoecetes opilio]|uniref:Uncharacterized protein n=1 Tax=Chionoecetes opilio TaxID=41210 RepID=A0A8J4YH39_CHIOP|nr:hypothetical protein GWK47_046925 [Chionoecetes opilio]
MRRTDPTTGINIIGMCRDTPIPQQIDKFWASQENKKNLQLLARYVVYHRAYSNVTVIASSIVSDDEVLPAKQLVAKKSPNLLSWIEKKCGSSMALVKSGRMLPLHQVISHLGAPLAKTVIKAHVLTGDDCMSGVGNKHAAMACDPLQYLTNFGETDSLVRARCSISREVLGTCLGRSQINYDC